ncbi:hypothetical protein DID78_04950, partial [Candidatus Marinamargulisbacteria bacterium SCGC AG-343-D04]
MAIGVRGARSIQNGNGRLQRISSEGPANKNRKDSSTVGAKRPNAQDNLRIIAQNPAASAKSGWEAIAPELFLKIFDYSSNADKFQLGRVCKSWREGSRDPKLWKHVDIKKPIWHRKPESYELQIGAIRIMLELARSKPSEYLLKSIHCNALNFKLKPTGASLFTPYILQSPQLEFVSLKDQCLSVDTLTTLFKNPHMQRLDLIGIKERTYTMTEGPKISYSQLPEFMRHEGILGLSIPLNIHACPLSNEDLLKQFKERFPQLKTLCLSNSPDLTWDEAQAAYDVFKGEEIETSFSGCTTIFADLTSKMKSNSLTNEEIDSPLLFQVSKYGATTLICAINCLSGNGEAGIAIINAILEKFKDRDELFQADNHGWTALMWALNMLADKGEAGIAIIQKILDKFKDRKELFKIDDEGTTVLMLALESLSGKGEAGIAIIQQILDKFLDRPQLFQVTECRETALTIALIFSNKS